jgi:ABC-2 type transport system permease protein
VTEPTDAKQEGRRRGFARLVLLVARRDYVRTVRRRGFVFGTLLLPLAIGSFIGLSALFSPSMQSNSGPPVALVVVNHSALPIAAPAGSDIRVLDSPEAQALLDSGAIREFYVVPRDYPAVPHVGRVAASRAPALDDLQRLGRQEQMLARLMRVALLADANVTPETMARVLQPFEASETAPDGSVGTAGFEIGFLLPYGFVFLFVMSIFITSGYLLQSVTEEKENRVAEILLSSVPSLPLMAGKILGLGAAGLTQVCVWIATALVGLSLIAERLPGLGGLEISVATTILALAYFVLGYLCFGAIFAAIGALAPGAREAQSYSGFLGFFAVVPLIFASVFLSDPSSTLVTVLALIPLTAPVAMLQILAVSPEPPWPLVIASLTSLSIFAVLAAVGAARVFRATLLLYGVRPSVRRIVGAITARS